MSHVFRNAYRYSLVFGNIDKFVVNDSSVVMCMFWFLINLELDSDFDYIQRSNDESNDIMIVRYTCLVSKLYDYKLFSSLLIAIDLKPTNGCNPNQQP